LAIKFPAFMKFGNWKFLPLNLVLSHIPYPSIYQCQSLLNASLIKLKLRNSPNFWSLAERAYCISNHNEAPLCFPVTAFQIVSQILMATSEITKPSGCGARTTGADYMHCVWEHEGQQVPKRIITTCHVTSRADVRPDKQVSHSPTHSNSFSLPFFPFESPEDGWSCRVPFT
jgi:hypothetical protein